MSNAEKLLGVLAAVAFFTFVIRLKMRWSDEEVNQATNAWMIRHWNSVATAIGAVLVAYGLSGWEPAVTMFIGGLG